MKQPLSVIESEQEAVRLSTRANIRRDLARAQLLREQADACDVEIRRINDVIATAVDLHSTTCTPLQAELRTLEAAAIERIKNRQEPNPAEDDRRREVLAEIQRANTELKLVRDRQAALAQPLEIEAANLRVQATGIPTEVLLTRKGIAHPELRLQYVVSGKLADLAQAQLEHAQALADRTGDNGQRGTVANLDGKEWAAVAAAVATELARHRAETNRLYRALIDE